MRTDWKNDVLDASMDGKRRYTMVTNDDGTVSFIDSTKYEALGDEFGADQLNEVAEEFNKVLVQNNLDVPADGWTSDTTFTDYGYKNTISTDIFAKVAAEDININSVIKPSGVVDNTWVENMTTLKGIILADYAKITTTDITLYASEIPEFDCVLTVEGV